MRCLRFSPARASSSGRFAGVFLRSLEVRGGSRVAGPESGRETRAREEQPALPLRLGRLKKANLTRGRGFPGGAVVKNPPANAGDMGSSPGPGRSHMPRSN